MIQVKSIEPSVQPFLKMSSPATPQPFPNHFPTPLPGDHVHRIRPHHPPLRLRGRQQLGPQRVVHAAGRAEVRDAGARGDARAGEAKDGAAAWGPWLGVS